MTQHEQMKEMLHKLENELKTTKTNNSDKQQAIDKLHQNVEEMMAVSDEYSHPALQALNKNLKESILLFEAEHPKLAEAIDGLLTTLENMGI